MKIVVRYNVDDATARSMVRKLTDEGFEAKHVRGGVICDLQRSSTNYEAFLAPSNVREGTLLLDVAESGGGLTRTGSSQIVCGLTGKALKPYFRPQRGHLSNGDHAFFAVVGSVATVNAEQNSAHISIQSHRIQENGGNVFHILKDVIWEGLVSEMPDCYSGFSDAVQAAIDKANCYHCREAHYFDNGE